MTRLIPALVLVAALLPMTASAQSFAGFDQCGYAWTDGLRLYFDASVETGCQGILMNPGYYAWSSTGSVAAYLVLTDASAPALTGWQADLAIFGDGAVTGHAVLAVGAVDEGTGDTHLVSLPSPVPTSLHTVLAVWTLALQPGNPQFGLDWGRMEFWLAPAAGRPEADPGYFDGDGAFHGCQSLNSAYHGWGTVPCMLLNDGYGVTDAEARSFGGLKALYR